MNFKPIKKKVEVGNDIESLFRDLKTNGVESLYSHQADILRQYQETSLNERNVAIELPTGSGKTLIGLLIAEYKRLKFDQKVVYLCPTKQLVHQATDLAINKYGIHAVPFTGSKNKYEIRNKTAYQQKDAIAITTYNSLFNVNPYFVDPDLVIIDDAHTSENYISSCWSLSIQRSKHRQLYLNLVDAFRFNIDEFVYYRLIEDDIDPLDKKIINILPQSSKDIITMFSLIDAAIPSDLAFEWSAIKDHLHACNVFYCWDEILIRPVIPPSLSNLAFRNAQQRIFMSATLGNGGDLERTTGVKRIKRIPIPDGWDKQGLGRRFFQFPSLSLDDEEITELLYLACRSTPRTVFLVSSETQANEISELLEGDFDIYNAKDIEESKSDFIISKQAIAILANRFDGIDFPGDSCRLLILKDLPYHANIQEKFLQSRVEASIIFYDRNRTRLLQAIGRTTRSPKDYSAVIAIGEKGLLEWLFLPDKHRFFHPELQAELKFGISNSVGKIEDYLDNLKSFFNQDELWTAANKEILSERNLIHTSPLNEIEKLQNSIEHEIDYLYSLWEKDFLKALHSSDKVLEYIAGGSELKGYRAFWKYLKSNLSYQLYKETNEIHYQKMSEELLQQSAEISSTFRSIRSIVKKEQVPVKDARFKNNIERIVEVLSEHRISHPNKFHHSIKLIEDQVNNQSLIEHSQLNIGKLIGFRSQKSNTSGSPDPYWITSDDLIVVFEDKIYEDEKDYIPIKDIRQLNSHDKWIKNNEISTENRELYIVLVSNRTKIEKAHSFITEGLFYWSYEDYRTWALNFLSFIKSLQAVYISTAEDYWREYIETEYNKKDFTPEHVIKNFKPLKDIVEN